MKRSLMAGATVVAVAMAFATPDARAQSSSGVPNAVQGFSQNRNQPIKIESNSLEVRDKEKIATFIDNVKLTQGDTMLETKRLIVFYEQDDPAGARRPAGQPGSQGIKRLEAKGGVVVTQRDQTAVGEEGIYDMKQNSVVLIGKVVVTQGQNVIRGDRLRVDLTTGSSVVEASPGSSGRVETILIPNSAPQAPAQAAPAPPPRAPSAAPAHRPTTPRAPTSTSDRGRQPSASGQPMRLN